MGFVRKGEFVRSFIHALSSTHYVGAPSRREPNGRSAPADGVFRVVEGADPYGVESIPCAEGSVGRENKGAVSLPQRGKVSGVSLTDEVLAKSLILYLSI